MVVKHLILSIDNNNNKKNLRKKAIGKYDLSTKYFTLHSA